MSTNLYLFIDDAIKRRESQLSDVSEFIWKNPELYFKEFKAHDYLTELLRDEGFQVLPRYLGIETAFRADFTNEIGPNRRGPVICVICEYDALPDIGHACGHNLICEAGLGAGLALRDFLEAHTDIPGTVVVLGTPAEEFGGGKVELVNRGAFRDMDIAMMVHPSDASNELAPVFIGIQCITVEYFGRASHAAGAPWDGLNALDAAVSCYNGLAYLRQHMQPDCRIHAIIKDGGRAANIVPAYSKLEIIYRAPTFKSMAELKRKVLACAEAGALTTQCTVEIKDNFGYHHLTTNEVVADLFAKHAKDIGVTFQDNDPKAKRFLASSDMGNVTHTLPSIHPIYRIPSKGANHTPEFTQAASTPEAQAATIIQTRAMARAGVDFLLKPELVLKAKQRFEQDLRDDGIEI